jgi:deazaflavin-dependent oxidoreductase (nitroreductase family)
MGKGSLMQRDWNVQNRQVIAEFRANRGWVGGYFADKPLLLLTTTGARSGQRRVNPLGYLRDGEDYVVFGTVAGSPRHPDWYYNVLAHPEVEVEIADERFSAKAAVVTGAVRDRLCALHAAKNPGWGEYLSMTSREIPVIALQRRRCVSIV